jgi:hypothetical protein
VNGSTNGRALRAGDWVEVRIAEEILATLDDRGRLEGLPFMPEMLQYCGKRFRVFKSAHKTCDTIQDWKTMRGMPLAVHLVGLRCDGSAHGGCEAGCMLFWKEAWLKPVPGPEAPDKAAGTRSEKRPAVGRAWSHCDREGLARATRVRGGEGEGPDERYRCQATELVEATTPLRRWDARPYLKDLASGNVRFLDFVRYIAIAAFNAVMRLHWRGRPYPHIRGLAEGQTPNDALNLQPGEIVQVRSKNEIMRTINAGWRNRGLKFDVEMVPYCGRTFPVLRRVARIIDERTGKMMRLPNPCLILADVTCSGCLSQHRLFCPRSIYPFWHEAWLKRVGEAAINSGTSNP